MSGLLGPGGAVDGHLWGMDILQVLLLEDRLANTSLVI